MFYKDFVKAAGEKHAGAYEYTDNLLSISSSHKFNAHCSKHDTAFSQTVNNHLAGKTGCKQCSADKRREARSDGLQTFIVKSEAVFGKGAFDYSKTEYANNSTPITLTCIKHDKDFKQSPAAHYRGAVSCAACFEEAYNYSPSYSRDDFISDCTSLFGDRYNYSEVDYVDNSTKVVIHCNIHNEDFLQSPSKHKAGQLGCEICRQDRTLERSKSLIKANLSELKDVVEVNYKGSYQIVEDSFSELGASVTVYCKDHDVTFECWGTSIRDGLVVCPECRKDVQHSQSMGLSEFTLRAENLWDGKYDYSEVKYKNIMTPIAITCKDHEKTFLQSPDNHLRGFQGCSSCSLWGTSKGEQEVVDFVDGLGVDYKSNCRSAISPFEIDLIIPCINLAIEFNGTYYHSDIMKKPSYHKNKYDMASKAGLDMLFIWEHDWNISAKREIIKNMIKSRLGVLDSKKVAARKCEIRDVNVGDYGEFFDEFHIQGSPKKASYAYGLYFEDELVSVMTFIRKDSTTFDLSRFCSRYNVQGAASKLLKHFKRHVECRSLISFSDNQTFSGGLYSKLGFVKCSDVKPDYKVYHPISGIKHKFAWRRNMIPLRLSEIGRGYNYFDPKSDVRSEWDVQDEVRALRVWDAGKIKWEIKL